MARADRKRRAVACACVRGHRSLARVQLFDVVREAKAGDTLVAKVKAQLAGTPASGLDDIKWVDEEDGGAGGDYKSEAGNAARTVLANTQAEESKLESELRSAKEDSGLDFGPDAAFYSLKGKCFDLRVNQYTYNVCPYGTAKQDHTSLGCVLPALPARCCEGEYSPHPHAAPPLPHVQHLHRVGQDSEWRGRLLGDGVWQRPILLERAQPLLQAAVRVRHDGRTAECG